MRLLKVSLHITFQDDTWYHDFAKGEELILSGYLKYYDTNIVLGYLKQEPITCNSSVFYVKGYWNNSELILVETTKYDGLNNNSSITLCSYFPSLTDGNGYGYVDEATGIFSKEGMPFFIGGDYLSSDVFIQMKELMESTADYASAEKKLNRMITKFYLAKKHINLSFGHLLDYIQPHYSGVFLDLIHIYPDCPE